MPNKMQVVYQDEVIVCAAFGNLVVTILAGELTPVHVDKVVESTNVAARNGSGKTAALSIIRLDKTKVSATIRTRLDRIMEERRALILGVGNVVTGEGLGAATLRAMMAAMFLIGRSSYPVKTFARAFEALDWVMPFVENGTPEDKASLARQVAEFEKSLGKTLAA